MYNQPSVAELVEAVKTFVDETAMPELTGRSAFHARVASNVLGTISRDIRARETNDAEERARLQLLLDLPDEEELSVLNDELSRRLRAREISANSAKLMSHLKKTAIAQVKVDQPSYSGLLQALKEV
ncbi:MULTISPECIES: DUF6285 domain-containing protein [Henriciella]|jgi:hypothetical protein|uniref:DUF6285 domain-containing protein n=1 Tax=Henriciella pelagia TaxID=1977912 RepID=A0ABQ1J687_9PROT|nr:DUF6285 domain-containing protein [Henriciella pelagia]GGB58963.1 hypothetical protein GCM10011503_04220 [Henriciella pelagia]